MLFLICVYLIAALLGATGAVLYISLGMLPPAFANVNLSNKLVHVQPGYERERVKADFACVVLRPRFEH
jgi:hypothetical protein